MADLSPRHKLLNEVKLRLGAGIIDLELDPDHYNLALDMAFGRYRQRSTNAMEESFVFLDVQPDQAVYTMPDEVQEVRSIYRRTIGGAGGGASIDPFSLSFTNNIYMIQNPGGLGGGGSGMLATYDLAMQFQSLAGRMFGREVMYTWNPSTKKLKLERRFSATEQIAVHVFNAKPDAVILGDVNARPWMRDYTVAMCKQILGEARGKFQSIAGPQGGITLNGEALKTEASAEFERLDKELELMIDQHMGMPFVIG